MDQTGRKSSIWLPATFNIHLMLLYLNIWMKDDGRCRV